MTAAGSRAPSATTSRAPPTAKRVRRVISTPLARVGGDATPLPPCSQRHKPQRAELLPHLGSYSNTARARWSRGGDSGVRAFELAVSPVQRSSQIAQSEPLRIDSREAWCLR